MSKLEEVRELLHQMWSGEQRPVPYDLELAVLIEYLRENLWEVGKE